MDNTFNLRKFLAEGKLLEEETSPIELKIQKLIDQNFKAFSQLGDSEVSQFELNEIPSDIVAYLKTIERFDYKNIVIYYVEDKNQIWVENTGAEFSK
jgi:NurA-like 5'-3' nuclease